MTELTQANASLKQPYQRGDGVRYKGKWYRSMTHLCETHGVSYPRFINRVRRGWDLEKALDNFDFNKVPARDHLGQDYSSTKEMVEHYGLRVTTFNNRIRQGWSLEKALTHPVQEKTGDEYCRIRIHKDLLPYLREALAEWEQLPTQPWQRRSIAAMAAALRKQIGKMEGAK